MVVFDDNVQVDTPARLNAEQVESLADLPKELQAQALGVKQETLDAARVEESLSNSPFEESDIRMARQVMIRLALMGTSEAMQYRAACKILDDATVKVETRFKSKTGYDKHSTVNNIIVAVNRAKELSDRS